MILDRDNWREILHTLKKNKLRSALTAFGVFWGIFILMIMLGVGKGLHNGATKDFSGMAANSIFVWAMSTTKPYKGFSSGRNLDFTNDDTEAIRLHIPEIEHLAPRNQLDDFREAVNVVRGKREGAFGVFGDYPEVVHITLMNITLGRFINPSDLEETRKVAVIGTRVRKILFLPHEDPIGQYIRIQGIYFKVVGVFKPQDDESKEETESIFIPFSTFQRAFNFGNLVSWFSMTVKPGIPASEVEKKVVALLAERHRVAPDDTHAIGKWNREKGFNKITDLFTGIYSLFWFVGVLTLLAGVIGVSNIMLVIIKERTPEFGIKRAIGATPFAIVGQIVSESILLTTVSGYTGMVCGVGVIEFAAAMLGSGKGDASLFENPEVNLTAALIALAILIVSGALAGLVPGIRAIRIKPVDAMRNL